MPKTYKQTMRLENLENQYNDSGSSLPLRESFSAEKKEMSQSKFKNTEATRSRLTIQYILDNTSHSQSSIAELLNVKKQTISSILKEKQQNVRITLQNAIKKHFPKEFEDAFLFSKEEHIFNKFAGSKLSIHTGKEVRRLIKKHFRDGKPWNKEGLRQSEFDKKHFNKDTPYISRLASPAELDKGLMVATVQDLYKASPKFATLVTPILKQAIQSESKKIKSTKEVYLEITDSLSRIENLRKVDLMTSIITDIEGLKNKKEILEYLKNKLGKYSNRIE